MRDFNGKKIIIVGAGKSGQAAAAMLKCQGADPVIYDENKDLNEESVYGKLTVSIAGYLKAFGSIPVVRDEKNGNVIRNSGSADNADKIAHEIRIIKEALSDAELDGATEVIMSPGVPVDTPLVERFKSRGLRISGEIELAYECSKGRLIAITGTNGKTTTTALTGAIVKDYFGRARVVGNIGDPYTDAALYTTDDDVTVAEISSFQLETTETFHPQVSAILNITPDHLNRHHTMENYAACKESVTANQTADDCCVLNHDDPYTLDFGKRCPCRVIWFSSTSKLDDGYYLEDENIYKAEGGKAEKLFNVHEMKLLGRHNAENVMAAIAMTSAIGIPMESIIRTVKGFEAVEHRIEYVRTVKGVAYYNDSKGTNPDAAIKAIEAMERKTVLIGGGYDKQNTYDEWIEAFGDKVSSLILLGQTKDAAAVKDLLGHSSLTETIDAYIYPQKSTKKEIANVMDKVFFANNAEQAVEKGGVENNGSELNGTEHPGT